MPRMERSNEMITLAAVLITTTGSALAAPNSGQRRGKKKTEINKKPVGWRLIQASITRTTLVWHKLIMEAFALTALSMEHIGI